MDSDTKLLGDVRIKHEVPEEDFNPWAVSDASVFLRYCCPECEFQSKGLITFGEHALTNHHRSSVLFKPEETELQCVNNADNSEAENCDPLLIEAKEETNFEKSVVEPENCGNLVVKKIESISADSFQLNGGDKKVEKSRKRKQFMQTREEFESEPPKPNHSTNEENCNSSKVEAILKDEKKICKECGAICDTKLQLYEHCVQYHSNKKKPMYYKCNHCDFVTDKCIEVTDHSLVVHKKEHQYPCRCSKCSTTRKTRNGLHSHVIRSHNSTICEHCAKSFTNPAALSKHIRNMHSTETYICESCGFSTNSKSKLYNHNRSAHLTDKMETCPHCGKQFPHSTKLEVHIDRVHSDSGPKNYMCDKCDKTFIYERSLKNHKYHCTKQEWIHEQRKREKMGLTKKVTFHKPKGKPVTNTKRMEPTKCDYCDVVFERRAQICRHYKDFHPGKPILLENIELFKCDECDAVYTQGMALNIHVIKAHGKRTAHKKFCEDCKLEYVDVHKCRKDNESGSGTFPCKFCGQIFRWRASMFRHEKNIHGEDRFSCAICHKKFVTSSQLSHHTKYSHTPVNCDVCGKTIRSEYDLKRHKAFMHHDDSAWFCPTCPKKKVFFSKEQFDRHMAKSHTILS